MCRRVRCLDCGLIGYEGCGKHIEEVLRDIPEEERCKCLPALEDED